MASNTNNANCYYVSNPATPPNIVIGGASGAMPPILGWSAVNNVVSPESLILFLIVFAWTPPHFCGFGVVHKR